MTKQVLSFVEVLADIDDPRQSIGGLLLNLGRIWPFSASKPKIKWPYPYTDLHACVRLDFPERSDDGQLHGYRLIIEHG
jgi:hypothetical protein